MYIAIRVTVLDYAAKNNNQAVNISGSSAVDWRCRWRLSSQSVMEAGGQCRGHYSELATRNFGPKCRDAKITRHRNVSVVLRNTANNAKSVPHTHTHTAPAATPNTSSTWDPTRPKVRACRGNAAIVYYT